VLIFIELGLRPNPVADQIFASTNSLFHRSSLTDSQDNSLALEKRVEVISSLLSDSVDVKTASSFVATIQSLLPERYSGEIDKKLQILKESSSVCSPAQIAELAVYLVSNNVISDYKLGTFVKWLTQEIPEGVLRDILNSKTLTIQAFKQKLFEKAADIGEETFRILVETEPEKSYLTGPIGQRCLQIAASKGKIEIVRILLGLGVSPDSVTSTDEDDYDFIQPPLHYAASNLDYDMLTLLINAGADVNSLAASDTPLSRAIDNISCLSDDGVEFSYDCIRALIEAGANVDYFGMEEALLDRAYLVDDKLYRILLASSKAAKTELTVSGILDAAMHGIQALSEYLDDRKKFCPRKALELSLFEAIPSHSAALMTLLEFGVDPNGPSSKDYPLIKAISQDRIDLVSTLLGYNADINLPGVLSRSAQSPRLLPILDFLIKQGADIRRFGSVALGKALDNDNLSAVKLLLISGVDINSWIPDHGAPICIAAAKCDVRTVEYLVNAGAEVNAGNHRKTGRTALLRALECQEWTTAKFLLQHGADAQINSSGKTLLEASLGSYGWSDTSPEEEEMFEILLNRGVQINGPPKRRLCADWNSALTLLIQKGAKEKTIQLALDAGADVNQAGSGSGSRTPIQAAASKGNLAMVKELLSRGADINAPAGTIYGRTALQAACCLGMPNLELVRFLLDNDADVNAQPGIMQGLTALQGAAIQGHIKVATLLLDRGAEVNGDVAEADGRTALDGAAEHGRLDMVQFLLNVGAQSEVPGTTDYDRAIALANGNRHFVVADLLRSPWRSL
jgi:ankyrin repeat protein